MRYLDSDEPARPLSPAELEAVERALPFHYRETLIPRLFATICMLAAMSLSGRDRVVNPSYAAHPSRFVEPHRHLRMVVVDELYDSYTEPCASKFASEDGQEIPCQRPAGHEGAHRARATIEWDS